MHEQTSGTAVNLRLLQKLIEIQLESLKDEMNQQLVSYVRKAIVEDTDKQTLQQKTMNQAPSYWDE